MRSGVRGEGAMMATTTMGVYVYGAYTRRETLAAMTPEQLDATVHVTAAADADWTRVGTAEVTITLDTEAEVMASRIATLVAERELAGKMFAESVRRIDADLAKLPALEWVAS